jgi:hypothetical protein
VASLYRQDQCRLAEKRGNAGKFSDKSCGFFVENGAGRGRTKGLSSERKASVLSSGCISSYCSQLHR